MLLETLARHTLDACKISIIYISSLTENDSSFVMKTT